MQKRIKTLQSRITFDERYESPDLLRFLKKPEKYLFKKNRIKTDIKTSVFKVTIDGHVFIVKRYNVKDFLYRLCHCFSKSRAANCWRAARRVLDAGVNTPTPVAYIETHTFWLKKETYYIYKYQEAELLSNVLSSPAQIDLCHAVSDILEKLKAAMISHGDMKATNWLVNKEGSVILIDLDATKQYVDPTKFKLARSKDEQRFLKNWATMPTLLDYFRSKLTNN